MHDTLRRRATDGRIRVGLLGHGIGESLSPALHMHEAALLGLDYEYVTIDLIDRPDVDVVDQLDELEREGFAAVNVTHPFKQTVVNHVDRTSPTADLIGSSNLVLFSSQGRTAHNTDLDGFRSGLEDFLGPGPRGSVLQVGAGGAGRATAYGLIAMGFQSVIVADRDPAAVHSLVNRLAPHAEGRLEACAADTDARLRSVEGVVHVTPTGMREHPGVAFDVDLLREDTWVCEVVYRPLATELVRRARGRGLPTLDGGPMAVRQAALGLWLITGVEPDLARMHQHFLEMVVMSRLDR